MINSAGCCAFVTDCIIKTIPRQVAVVAGVLRPDRARKRGPIVSAFRYEIELRSSVPALTDDSRGRANQSWVVDVCRSAAIEMRRDDICLLPQSDGSGSTGGDHC